MAKYTKIVEFDMTDAWNEHTIQKLNYDFKSLQNSIGSESGDSGPYNYNDLINTPTVEGSFVIAAHPVLSSQLVDAGGYLSAETVVENDGYYPLGIVGWATGNTRYAAVYRCYLVRDTIQVGSVTVTAGIHNTDASGAHNLSLSVHILWAKWDNDSNSIYGTPLSVSDVEGMISDSIGNGTITIKQGNVTKGTFELNQANNQTITLSAGGGSGGDIDLTTKVLKGDGSGNAVAVQSGDLPNAMVNEAIGCLILDNGNAS